MGQVPRENPPVVPPPRLSIERQAYLFNQIRDFVPETIKTLLCPKPVTSSVDSEDHGEADSGVSGHGSGGSGHGSRGRGIPPHNQGTSEPRPASGRDGSSRSKKMCQASLKRKV